MEIEKVMESIRAKFKGWTEIESENPELIFVGFGKTAIIDLCYEDELSLFVWNHAEDNARKCRNRKLGDPDFDFITDAEFGLLHKVDEFLSTTGLQEPANTGDQEMGASKEMTVAELQKRLAESEARNAGMQKSLDETQAKLKALESKGRKSVYIERFRSIAKERYGFDIEGAEAPTFSLEYVKRCIIVADFLTHDKAQGGDGAFEINLKTIQKSLDDLYKAKGWAKEPVKK